MTSGTMLLALTRISLIVALASGLPTAAKAASDADVTIIKASSVIIGDNVITITAEARTTVRLISGDPNPGHQGDTWHGRPVSTIQIKSDQAVFIIKRPLEAQEALASAWKESLDAAKDLRLGKEIGRIGYYAPEMSIKGNLLTSMTGFGFLYKKRE
ncbi:MAG: hypothetical protein V4675_00740 [Verrucomicrobiota bacterium]